VIISCPSCEKQLRVPDDMVGQDRVVKCPACNHHIKLPDLATTAKPSARPATAAAKQEVDRLDDLDDEPRGKSRPSSQRARDDEDDEDRPRARKNRSRDDDDDDDRPARRKPSKSKKKGSKVGLIIGLVAGGVCLLLLIGCGIGGYLIYAGAKGGLAGLVDNPAVTDANYSKVKLDMLLPDVEAIFGPGGICSDADARGILVPAGGAAGPMGMQDQLTAIANDPKSFGLTSWYRWKNGPTTMLIGVDGANKVRVSGLFTVTPNSTSRKTQSNVSQPGGFPGKPGKPKR